MATAEVASRWAHSALAAKNSLTAEDAKCVEDAFESRLSRLISSEGSASSIDITVGVEANAPHQSATTDHTDAGQGRGVASGVVESARIDSAGPHKSSADKGGDDTGGFDMSRTGTSRTDQIGSNRTSIDKSVLALPAPRRYRDQDHLRYIAKQPCLICGRKPSDPHHLRYLQPRALGRKASDEYVVPLCRIHHRLVHRVGNESAWWKDAGIDPVKVARKLWKHTRANQQARIGPDPRPQVAPADRSSEVEGPAADMRPSISLQPSASPRRPD
jgi:hypothetical protein